MAMITEKYIGIRGPLVKWTAPADCVVNITCSYNNGDYAVLIDGVTYGRVFSTGTPKVVSEVCIHGEPIKAGQVLSFTEYPPAADVSVRIAGFTV